MEAGFYGDMVHTLEKTHYEINREYPDEIVKARARLNADYKAEKPKDRKGKVYIGIPITLVVEGTVARSEFPVWRHS